MDGNYSTRYTKTRPMPNFYHATYGRTYRQNEYAFAKPRNSALLFHDGKQRVAARSKRGKYCSIALAAATFLVLVAVLAIAGLALYMGALRTETTTTPLVTFACRAKILRGDRFLVGLAEKARRYRAQLEMLFERSVLSSAFVSNNVDKFGNDTRTIFFRVTLNKRKIPKNIVNIEKSIRDILLGDAQNRKPVFPGVQFDPKSINIKRVETDMNQRLSPQRDKEIRPSVYTKPQPSMPLKNKKNATKEAQSSSTSGGSSILGGSFKISKTDADITEMNGHSAAVSPSLSSSSSSVKTTVKPKLKETYVTSALFKLAASGTNERTTKKVTTLTANSTTRNNVTSNTTHAITTPIIITQSTTKLPEVSSSTTIKAHTLPIGDANINQEPWIPIIHHQFEGGDYNARETATKSYYPGSSEVENSENPVYTSFTNQGLSWQNYDVETLGSTKLQGHPIPVNKIPDPEQDASSVYFTTPYSLAEETDGYANIEEAIMQGIENREILDAHTLELITTNKPEMQSEQIQLRTGFHHNISAIPGETSDNTGVVKSTENPNVGHAEVISVDEVSLIMPTTKLPLVTLLPVKSNSGVGRPIRPRPKRPDEELRGFLPSEASTSKVSIQTEVVTSISREGTKPPRHKFENFQIMSVLHFATEIEPSTSTTPQSIQPQAQAFQQILTAEQLQELAKISKLTTNASNVISTKAVAGSSYQNGLLTKTYNKLPSQSNLEDVKNNKDKPLDSVGYNRLFFESINASECTNYTIKCGDGQCLPNSTRCNNMVDCSDGSDELNCTCADYLRSQFLLKKICDGIVDCWDFSDENQCDWCLPSQYVCANSKLCINRTSICDGITDCPHGDDERQCVTVSANMKLAEEFSYQSDGYLMVRKNGTWGKFCVENFSSMIAKSKMRWKVDDLGQAVCKEMTYKKLDSTKIIKENTLNALYEDIPYYELTYNLNNRTKSSLSFEQTHCTSKEVVLVKCQSLECGARPQVGKKNARIVGGGNAGLGAWPWQAALYKEGEFQCGGTLITDRWLLSAGHCFYHSQKEHWVARMGNLRRGTSLPSPYEQLRTIVKIILHPSYVDVGFLNDISLLKMNSPVVFSDYVRPICLPSAGIAPSDGRICTVIGWGQLFEIGRIFPDTLQEVQVPIISTAECRKRTLFLPLYQVTDDMFCAGYDRGGRDACLGDSGGPLMCAEPDGRWVLHGITSNGYGCARAFRPGVYTKVANYITWLQSHTGNTTIIEDSIVDKCSGHRCPLGECLPKSRLCNGFIECSDGSDEKGCLNNQ